MRRLLCFFLAVLVLAAPSQAQQAVSVSVALEPRAGTVDDSYTFAVIINGGTNIGYPYLIGGDDFKLSLIGPQTSMRIENGVTTRQVSYNYRLLPKRAGLLWTPGAEVEVNGVKHKVEPLRVRVANLGAGAAQPARKDKYFIVQSFDKSEAFVGEQVLGTIELYTSLELDELQYSDLSFDGFWSEDLGKHETTERVIDGTRYTLLRLRKALFPLAAGALRIPARELKAKAVTGFSRRRAANAFDFNQLDPFNPNFLGDFFGRKIYEPVVITSNTLELKVKPLPPLPAGWPAPSQGGTLVGHTSVSTNYDPTDMKVGESKTLKVTITSYGNLNTFKKLSLAVPEGLKLYEELPAITPIESDGKLISKKTFTLSLVATRPGKFVVPAIEIPYLNPETGEYALARGQAASFSVNGVAQQEQQIPAAATPPQSEPAAEATAEPDPSTIYVEEGAAARLVRRFSLSSMALVAALAILSSYLAYSLARFRRDGHSARQLFSRISSAQSIDDLHALFSELLTQRFGLAEREDGELDLRGVARARLRDSDLLFAVQSTMDMFEELRYGGHKGDPAALETLRKNVGELAKSL